MESTPPPEQLVVADADAWRAWLDANETRSDGIRLVLAKKGVTEPTSLTYAEALEEALCSGWIDGRRNALDESTFQQLFTPRRKASMWSQRNVDIVARLIADGRMRERGHAEIERAKADGRWERAYSGQAEATVPDDLDAALTGSPAAAAHFASLTRADRYLAIHQVITASTATLRAKRVGRFVAAWGSQPEASGLDSRG